jgi:3-methylcrotonyl-CoA carboxylase beta subunit
MGGDQAAFVLSRIKSQQLQAQGKILTQEAIEQLETPIRLQYERESSAYYSTAHLWDDGILMPSETRQVLARALSTVSYAPIPKTAWGVLRM